MFVGIDWATKSHQVCAIDGRRRVVRELAVEHSGSAIAGLSNLLLELTKSSPERAAVAIEIPRGAVVESLVERGFHVYAINPKQLDRFRDRHTVAGAKDDRRDAFVLADSVRTDRACFRRVQVDEPLVIQIRELSRVDEDLGTEKNGLTNRLREQLHRFYPQVLELCPSAKEPWIWALVELVPTPAAAARVRVRQIDDLLRAHRIRRVIGRDVLAMLRTPPLRVADGTVDACIAHIAVLIVRLRLVHEQRRTCEAQLEALLNALATRSSQGPASRHCDVDVLRSLPGIGIRVCSALIAEASQALAERDHRILRSHGGVAPVTHQSGMKRGVTMRYGCNNRLRNALYHWARVAAQKDPASGSQYRSLRERGYTHGRALRSVADRLLRMLVAMLKDGTLYDPLRCSALREALGVDAAGRKILADLA
jgi:transposase